MGELLLIHGPAHPGKGEELFRRCRERLDAGRGDSFLYLVPSRWQASQLRQRLLEATAAAGFLRPHLLGLSDLARSLYRLCPDRRLPLPPHALRLFAEEALRQLALSLPHFPASRPGLVQAATRLAEELETAGLSPEAVEGQLDHLAALDPDRVTGLRPLIRAYRQLLEQQWIDLPGMLRAIVPHLTPENLRRCFPRVDLLLVSGFDTFSPSLRPLLDRLFDLLPLSCVVLDCQPDRPSLFARVQPTFQFLRQRATRILGPAAMAPGNRKEITSPSGPLIPREDSELNGQVVYGGFPDAPIALLEPFLFTRATASLTAPVELVSCADRLAEVEEMARRIHHLHRHQQAPLSQIRVGFRHPDQYTPLVQEVFPRHGLPFHLSRGIPLLRAPVVVAVLALLDAVLDRYSRPALLRLLGLPWVRFTFPFADQEHRLEAADLDAWSRSLAVGPGRASWLQILDSRIAYLDSQLADARRGAPLADEIEDPEEWMATLQDEQTGLRQLRAGLESLFSLLAPLEHPLELEAFRRHLLEALGRLGFARPLGAAEVSPRQSREETRSFHAFCDLLDELCALAPCLGQRSFPLRPLAELLRATLARVALPLDPPRGVQVAGLHEAAGLPCDHLFIGGLVEGEFPHLPAPDLFLDDRARSLLGLEDTDQAIAADRLLFYRSLATPRRTLCLLWPRRQGNTTLSPSPLVDEVTALLEDPPLLQAPPVSATDQTLAGLHAALGRSLDRPTAPASAAPLLQALGQPGSAAPLLQALGQPLLLPSLRRLLHGIAITAERLRLDRPGPYEALLGHPRAIALLQSRLGPAHAFSPTQLETYARCPFQFFAARLLGVVSLPDPEADATALERGNLIHRALYYFFTARRRGQLVERITPQNLAAACQQLHDLVRREAEAMGLRGFFWEQELERLLGHPEDQGREGLLIRFLRQEAISADPASPAHFELSFGSYPGMGPRDPASTSTPFLIPDPEGAGEVRLFGKIDRLDRTADGDFAIYDYKTGQVPPLADIDRGLSLQLPLYLLAAETLLQPQGLRQAAAGAYYQLRDLEHCGRQGLFASAAYQGQVFAAAARRLPDQSTFRHLLDQTLAFVLGYARAMRAGRFPVTRHSPERTCTYCDYRQSCRLDPRRMRLLEREGRLP